ncbi:TPA: hypothetical protein HA251_05305, partial [Candidatus Woesearchaeota archaeon]|nr:hypothetical protein [Candidatus Woesearchaeota archaeon]
MQSRNVKSVFVAVAIIAMVMLAGCSIGGSRNENTKNNDYSKYYVGKQGIVTKYDNIPTRLYYYGPDDVASNAFTMSVEVANKGASFSRGGVFISGYDPRLLVFDEIPITGGALGGCGISIGNVGWGQLGGIFRCDGVEVSGTKDGGITSLKIDNIAELVNGISARFGGTQWFDPQKFDISVNYQDGPAGSNFVMNINGMEAYLDYFQHGRLFIALLSALDYRKNGGQEFLLAGNTYEFPGGERTYMNYHGKIVDWPVGLDQTTQNLLLTSCYQYTTFADPIICVDPDPTSENRKVCTPQSRTWGGGNGAPVAITSVEQENTPRKIIFHINVRNVGTGTVYDPGKLEKCSPYYPGRVTGEDLNVVYLGDVRIGSVGLRTSTGSAGGMQ